MAISPDVKQNIASGLMLEWPWTSYIEPGMSILDVGCAEGEIPIAMARKGAAVTAVEPDKSTSQLAKARFQEVGLLPDQVFQMNLQDFSVKFREKKFDVITIFLWNIPYLERDDVMQSAKSLLSPEGRLIITYIDEVYLKDPIVRVDLLAKKYFSRVNAVASMYPNSMSGGLHRFRLICQI